MYHSLCRTPDTSASRCIHRTKKSKACCQSFSLSFPVKESYFIQDNKLSRNIYKETWASFGLPLRRVFPFTVQRLTDDGSQDLTRSFKFHWTVPRCLSTSISIPSHVSLASTSNGETLIQVKIKIYKHTHTKREENKRNGRREEQNLFILFIYYYFFLFCKS